MDPRLKYFDFEEGPNLSNYTKQLRSTKILYLSFGKGVLCCPDMAMVKAFTRPGTNAIPAAYLM